MHRRRRPPPHTHTHTPLALTSTRRRPPAGPAARPRLLPRAALGPRLCGAALGSRIPAPACPTAGAVRRRGGRQQRGGGLAQRAGGRAGCGGHAGGQRARCGQGGGVMERGGRRQLTCCSWAPALLLMCMMIDMVGTDMSTGGQHDSSAQVPHRHESGVGTLQLLPLPCRHPPAAPCHRVSGYLCAASRLPGMFQPWNAGRFERRWAP